MPITIALFALFLILLAILAVVAARIFGARDAQGAVRATGIVPGCLFGLGLFFLAGLGLLALVGSLAVQTAGSVFEHAPDVKRIYVGTEPQHAFEAHQRASGLETLTVANGASDLQFESDPQRPLHLVFELPGHGAAPSGMVPWFREWLDEDVLVRRLDTLDEAGRPTTLIDVALPASHRDLNEIQRDMRLLVPGASWAAGLNVEFRGAAHDG